MKCIVIFTQVSSIKICSVIFNMKLNIACNFPLPCINHTVPKPGPPGGLENAGRAALTRSWLCYAFASAFLHAMMDQLDKGKIPD